MTTTGGVELGFGSAENVGVTAPGVPTGLPAAGKIVLIYWRLAALWLAMSALPSADVSRMPL